MSGPGSEKQFVGSRLFYQYFWKSDLFEKKEIKYRYEVVFFISSNGINIDV